MTFSVDTKYKDRIQETFTFEQLGLSVEMNDEKIKKENETMQTMTYKGFGLFMMIVGILYLKNFAKMEKQ